MTWWTQHARALDRATRSAGALEAAHARVAELRAELLPEQAAFAGDASPAVAACCSRRAGKSHALAVWLLSAVLAEPGGLSLYVTQTAALAREILWDGALSVLAPGLVELTVQQGQLMVRVPASGHRIWLAGCADRGEIAKFRGLKYRRAVVDEAQSIPWLQELLEEAVEPALLDYRGQLRLTGTPGPIPAGPFYDATTGSGWSVHRWALAQNTHLGDTRSWLATLRQRRGWTEQSPRYRREYLGEWVLDREALVYPYDAALCRWDGELPAAPRVRTVLGVDLGSTGTTAIVVVSSIPGQPQTYVRHAVTRTGLAVSQVVAWTRQLQLQWSAGEVVVDHGGLGAAYIADMVSSGIPAVAAEKTEKTLAIDHLAGDMRAGTVLVDARQCRPLVDEWSALVWDDEASERKGQRVYSERMADHAADACLYAHRRVRPVYRPEYEPPREGSREWELDQVRRAVRQREKRR